MESQADDSVHQQISKTENNSTSPDGDELPEKIPNVQSAKNDSLPLINQNDSTEEAGIQSATGLPETSQSNENLLHQNEDKCADNCSSMQIDDSKELVETNEKNCKDSEGNHKTQDLNLQASLASETPENVEQKSITPDDSLSMDFSSIPSKPVGLEEVKQIQEMENEKAPETQPSAEISACDESSSLVMQIDGSNLTLDKESGTSKPNEDEQCKSVLSSFKAHNTSLGLLMGYRSDSSDSESSDSSIVSINESLIDSIKVEDIKEQDALDDEGEETAGNKRRTTPLKVRGEFLIDDLPPIEDLRITVPEDECIEFGKIHSIVDQLVLVSPLPNSLLLDLDTVLFLEKGKKALGEIFDVLGQVADPLYCIRFNSNKQIKEKGIEIGQVVFAAPKTEHTQFIILSKISNNRGSDASWEHDVEPPERFLDYSDDEQEQRARSSFKNKNDSTNEAGNQQSKTNRKRERPERNQSRGHQQAIRFNSNCRNQPRNLNPFYYNHSSNHYANFPNPGFQQSGYVFNPYSIRPPLPHGSHMNVRPPTHNMNAGPPSHINAGQPYPNMIPGSTQHGNMISPQSNNINDGQFPTFPPSN